jgi:hypothetical protein
MEKLKAVGTFLLLTAVLVFIVFTIVVKSNRFGECLEVNSFMYCTFTQRDFLLWDTLYPFDNKK